MISIWNGIWWLGIAFLYFPLSQTRVGGEAAKDIFAKVDYIGGATSIGGLTLFLVALQAGGYSHPWTSAYVLATLIIGVLLIVVFVVWEWRFAKMPMVPREMFGKSYSSPESRPLYGHSTAWLTVGSRPAHCCHGIRHRIRKFMIPVAARQAKLTRI